MAEFVKCWSCNREQFMPYDNKCRSCGQHMELQKEEPNKDLRPINSTPLSNIKYPETKHQLPKGFGESQVQQSMQEIHCYDCLKTKGFGTTISLVILGVILLVAFSAGYIIIPENFLTIVLFLIFWIGLVGIAGMFVPSFIATHAIRDYCKKSDPDNYKATGNIIIFGICSAFALFIIVLTIFNLPSNYDWWITRACQGINYCG